jgi:hypothetical protein
MYKQKKNKIKQNKNKKKKRINAYIPHSSLLRLEQLNKPSEHLPLGNSYHTHDRESPVPTLKLAFLQTVSLFISLHFSKQVKSRPLEEV